MERKRQRYLRLLPKLTMSTPMYDNVSLHSSTHVYLCTISEKKSSWYVKKGLGERRGNVLTLNFEPDFMGDKLPGKPSDIEYHRRYKRNECVVCGSTSSGFMRHYVVPSCFRCLFPKRFKSHLSHDVVLVCSRCHVGVQAETGRRMTKVIWVVEGRRGNGVGMWVVDRGVMEARNAAVAIRKYRGKMPKDVVERHEEIIRGYLGRDFGEGDLEVMEKLEFKTVNPKYKPGPELVVEEVMEKGERGLEAFIKDWRRFFVSISDPRFLPEGWSVENKVTMDGIINE